MCCGFVEKTSNVEFLAPQDFQLMCLVRLMITKCESRTWSFDINVTGQHAAANLRAVPAHPPDHLKIT